MKFNEKKSVYKYIRTFPNKVVPPLRPLESSPDVLEF